MSVATRPQVLLIGATGQIGWHLLRALSRHADVAAPDRASLDLADPGSIRRFMRDTAPRAVVNAAAQTDVDGAEANPEDAFRINADAPGVLAEESARIGALFVHYSTDYVFDGRSATPYREESATAPLNVYGESKRKGEERVAAAAEHHLILRTSWVFGMRRRNFLTTMMRLARERERIEVVDDQVGAPTWSREIAESTVAMMRSLLDRDRYVLPREHAGIYHMSAGGRTTWFDFARAIMDSDPGRAEHRCRELVPTSSGEYGAPAHRPSYSLLDNRRLGTVFGIELPDWEVQLRRALSGP